MNRAPCEGFLDEVPFILHSHSVQVPGSLEASASQAVSCTSQILCTLQSPLEGGRSAIDFKNGL